MAKRSANLVERAAQAARNAYAPYSAFHVGAALQTEAGGVYVGCNVENSAFPVGGCAERHAIAAAVAAEGHAMRLKAIAVVALDPIGVPVPCAPCGALYRAGPDPAWQRPEGRGRKAKSLEGSQSPAGRKRKPFAEGKQSPTEGKQKAMWA